MQDMVEKTWKLRFKDPHNWRKHSTHDLFQIRWAFVHDYMIIRIALYITLRWCENTNDDDEMLNFFLFPLTRVRGIFCKSVNLVKTLPLRWITTSILICTAKNNVTTFYWEWFTAYCVGTDVFTTKLICIWWSKDLKVMLIRSREKHPYSMCNSTTAVTAAFFFLLNKT